MSTPQPKYGSLPRIKSGQPLSVALVGLPGSGKSTFARALCRRIGAKRVNGDDTKAEMFGSVDRANHDGDGQRQRRHRQAFDRVYAEAESILRTGRHLVRDYQHNGLANRQRASQLAAAHGAYHVVVWLEIDPQRSIARALARSKSPIGPGIPIWSRDRARRATAKTLAKLEPGQEDENIVRLDATKPVESQIDLFLARIGWRLC